MTLISMGRYGSVHLVLRLIFPGVGGDTDEALIHVPLTFLPANLTPTGTDRRNGCQSQDSHDNQDVQFLFHDDLLGP